MNSLSISQRIATIIQLCIAFSVMLWIIFQPFMGEYFTLRSRMLLYEYVMGTSEAIQEETQKNRQKERFLKLEESKRNIVQEDYKALQNYSRRPASKKIYDGFYRLMRATPIFTQAWIFFSLLISLLILLKIEGAKTAVWILPLLVFAYGIDNQLNGKTASPSQDSTLFPTEREIIEHYIAGSFSSSPLEQMKQLKEGWDHYLIKNWSSEKNSSFALEEGEFAFTVSRLQAIHAEPWSQWLFTKNERANPITLLIFLLWNGLFAWIIERKLWKQSPQTNL